MHLYFLTSSRLTCSKNVALPDDISIFANLIRLRVYLTGEVRFLAFLRILGGITPAAILQTITIALYPGQFNKQRYEQLDDALWMLPVPDPPVVEFEVDPAGYDTIVSHVPRVASTNIVGGWFYLACTLELKPSQIRRVDLVDY